MLGTGERARQPIEVIARGKVVPGNERDATNLGAGSHVAPEYARPAQLGISPLTAASTQSTMLASVGE